jgi:hypothetical protein
MEVLTLAVACHERHPTADVIFAYPSCPQPSTFSISLPGFRTRVKRGPRHSSGGAADRRDRDGQRPPLDQGRAGRRPAGDRRRRQDRPRRESKNGKAPHLVVASAQAILARQAGYVMTVKANRRGPVPHHQRPQRRPGHPGRLGPRALAHRKQAPLGPRPEAHPKAASGRMNTTLPSPWVGGGAVTR